jgi:hypothetical protein
MEQKQINAFPCCTEMPANMEGKGPIINVNTCPRRSSAITQPIDQMSMAVVYSVAPKISSGAR